MDELERANGDDRQSEGSRTRARFENAQRIVSETRALSKAIQRAAEDLQSAAREQCTTRPYATLVAAAGVGYVLGGGLASRLTKLIVDTATTLTMAVVARELSTRLGLSDK
jgi:ElaB/YqjD/DUF883 family membrane-anchored ribosome-binding protein